ncbi:hypothetical protein R6Q59_019319 [Mikania micrantha]
MVRQGGSAMHEKGLLTSVQSTKALSFSLSALYLIVVCFKFSTYFDTSSTPDNESVTKVRLDVSKLSIRSAYHDEISETVGNDNRFKRLSQQEKKLELKSGDSNRETLENERRFERVSQEEKDDGLPPIDLRYGRLTGNILRERHRTQDTELSSVLEGKHEQCPPWVSISGEELTKGGRIMFLPCGLAVGSSITVVGTPHNAHKEYVPQLAKTKGGDPVVLVSQFKVELQGLKSVVAEDPPKILHLNPQLRGDWSHQPVIEHNTCYRMQWGAAQRCDGLPSKGDDDMLGCYTADPNIMEALSANQTWMRNLRKIYADDWNESLTFGKCRDNRNYHVNVIERLFVDPCINIETIDRYRTLDTQKTHTKLTEA